MLSNRNAAPVRSALACDILIIGSGAAGLTAAIVAASSGLDVIVIEKSEYVGGATAWSGGWVWLPESKKENDAHKAKNYLMQALGSDAEQNKIDAFIKNAFELEKFLLEQTPVRFLPDITIPDYHSSIDGYSAGGRSRVVAPIDGRVLGDEIHRLRKPMQVLTIAGLMPSAGPEMHHFFNATRSLRSCLYVLKRLLRHGANCLTASRSLTLTNGNALAAGLYKAALDRDVRVLTSSQALSLTHYKKRVSGANVETVTGEMYISAARGVILACGGFPSDASARQRYYKHVHSNHEHWTVAPSDCDGDGLRLGEEVGAKIVTPGDDAGAWVPVSLVPTPDGTIAPFPHFADRAKPGLIAVRADGKRFTNEAAPYFHFMKGLFDACLPGEDPVAWLICDHSFQRRYGLGFSKPLPIPIGRYLTTGYLKRGSSLLALADQCEIDGSALCKTIFAYNVDASSSDDLEFRRGREPVNRAQGDPSVRPNPCVAPLLTPPFYAVKVQPGCLGSFAGLKTDDKTRVLDISDQPISGLFACGSDMASIMAGHYPASGISLEPALVFGYIAGRFVSEYISQKT